MSPFHNFQFIRGPGPFRKSEILQKHCCHEGILAYTNRLGAYTTQPPLSTEFQACHWTSSGYLFISGDTNLGNANVEVATNGVVDVEPPRLPIHTCLLKESFLTQWNYEFPHNLRIWSEHTVGRARDGQSQTSTSLVRTRLLESCACHCPQKQFNAQYEKNDLCIAMLKGPTHLTPPQLRCFPCLLPTCSNEQ